MIFHITIACRLTGNWICSLFSVGYNLIQFGRKFAGKRGCSAGAERVIIVHVIAMIVPQFHAYGRNLSLESEEVQ
jgi:hypothetical protein